MKKVFTVIVGLSLLSCTGKVTVQQPPAENDIHSVRLEKDYGKRKVVNYKLPNKLEVLLISDPSVNKSAAAMDVRIGSQAQPKDHLGLPHYLEHMLFLGTKKYPVVGEYDAFLSKHQGTKNAYTGGLDTNYFFDVNHAAFREALDRFAQFFVAPLFDSVYAEKEKHAVSSEHDKNVQNDGWREFRLVSMMAKKGHPQRNFATGNLETLKNVTRDDLLNFYSKYYSADRMKLVVISNRKLEVLAKWVGESFSAVPLKNTPVFNPPKQLFDKADLPRLVYAKPIADKKQVDFVFELPNIETYWRTKPGDLLQNALQNKGKGSLFSLLKKEGLALDVSVDVSDTGLSGILDFQVRLSDQGYKNVDRVGQIFFAYINTLKQALKQKNGFERYFAERKNIAQQKYDYRYPLQGAGDAAKLARMIQIYPAISAEERSNLFYKYNKDAVKEFLDPISPKNLNMFVYAPDVTTDQKEKYYGIEYKVTKLSKPWLKEFDNPKKVEASQMNFPLANIKIPKSDQLKLVDDSVKLAKPSVVAQDANSVTYFASDKQFSRPNSFVRIKLKTKANTSVKDFMLSKLYERSLNESLSEWLYPLDEAGFKVEIGTDYGKVIVQISGYSSDFESLSLKVLNKLKNINITEGRFENIKSKFKQELENQKFGLAYKLARLDLNSVSLSKYIHYKAYKDLVDSVKLQDLQNFASKKLLKTVGVETMVYGNEQPKTWNSFSQVALSHLKSSPLAKAQWPAVKALKWKKDQTWAYRVSAEENNNSVYWTKIQFGPRTSTNEALLEYAQLMLSDNFNQVMRTEKQFGYIVYGGMTKLKNSCGMHFIIQSQTHEPEEMALSTEDWLRKKVKAVAQWPQDDLATMKKSILTKLNLKEKTMDDYYGTLLESVDNYDANFGHKQELIKTVENLSDDDIRAGISDGLDLKNGGEMSIYYSAKGVKPPKLLPNEQEVMNPGDFRSRTGTY